MNDHCSGVILEMFDSSFSDAVLEVGIDAGEGYHLSLIVTVIREGLFCESAIVCVVMFDCNSMQGGESFECLLCLQSLITSRCPL